MSGKPRRNNYRIDVQNSTAIFEVKDKYGRVVLEFIIRMLMRHKTYTIKNSSYNYSIRQVK